MNKKDISLLRVVALKHDLNTNLCPQIIAKGSGEIAQKIIEIAKFYGIPINENENLINLLLDQKIGEHIPFEAFMAIAEILRYIYARNGILKNLKKI